VLLMGIVAGATLHVLPRLSVYDEQRLGNVLVLVLIALGAAVRTLREGADAPALLPRWAWGMLALAGALGIASALRAPLPRYGLLEVAHHGLIVVALVEVAATIRRQPEQAVRLVLYGLSGVVLLMELGVAVSYAMHVGGFGTPLFPKAGFSFGHIRHFNQVQTWTLPLLALPVLGSRQVLVRGGAFGVLALWWALLIASGGRGSLLAVVVGLAAAVLLHRKAAGRLLRVQGLGAMVGIGLFWLLFRVLAHGGGSVAERVSAGDSGRLQLWRTALEMVQAHPLLGVGPMHYAYQPVPPPPHRTAHPHNEPLRLLAELGIPAALIVMGLLGWALWGWIRFARAQEREACPEPWPGLWPVLTAALVGGSALGLVDGVLVMPVSQLLAVLVAGLALGLTRPRSGRLELMRALPLRAWALVAVLWAGLTVGCLLPDVRWLPARQEAFMQAYVQQTGRPWLLPPRFWQVGYIGDAWARPAPDGVSSR